MAVRIVATAVLALCLAVPAGALAGPNDTEAGVVTARSEGDTSLIVTMPYKGDGNANNTARVEYKRCVDASYQTLTVPHSASPYVVTISGLMANTCYDIRATYNEVSPEVVTGTNPQNLRISTTWDTTMLHNRNRFPGSTKWNENGGWGMPGTKYGQFTCETCHTSPTTNIKRIRETITTPDGSNWASTGTSSVSVIFRSTTTPNGFGDDTGGHTTSTKICEVCHSRNSVHNYNTTGQTDLNHNNNTDCTECHPHNLGFVGGGACDTCHGAPPGSGTDTNAPAAYAASHATHYDRAAGGLVTSYASTERRSTASAYVFDCGTCHSNSSADHTANIDGTVDVKLPVGGTYTAGSYAGGDNPPPPGSVTFKNSNGTCSTVYCHGNFAGGSGGTGANAPRWGGDISCSTNTCHGATTTATPAGGSHGSHVGTVSGMMLDCTKCHRGIAAIGTVSDKSKHVNYAADWNLDSTDARIGSGTYSGAQTGSKTPPSSTYGTCANMYCHSIVQTATGGPLTGAAGEYKTPTWGNQATGECGSCHALTISTGSHTKHLSNYLCGTCHFQRGDNTTFHANREINLSFSQPFTYGATPAYSPEGLNHSPGGGFSSCSNLYCHSIVQTATGGPLTGTAGQYKTVAWGGTLGCDGCHGSATLGTGLPATGSHAKHAVACTTCHTSNTAATHSAGTINFIAAINYSRGTSEPPGNNLYGTCSNLQCHSDGRSIWTGGTPTGTTPAWGGPALGCDGCHGNTVYAAGDYRKAAPLYASTTSGSGKPNAHDPHMDNRATPSGETRCRHCHYDTTTTDTSITTAANHGNNAYTVVTTGTAANTYARGEDVSTTAQVSMSYTFAGSPGISTCSTVSCHPTGTLTAANTSLTIPWDDLSAASYQCTDCHRINLTGATTYHHSMNSETYTPNSTTGYPTTVPQGHWSTGTNPTSRTCLMCHVKHNIFSNRMNTNAALTAPRAMNLRTAIGTAPTVSSGYANTDYLAGGGICISCHSTSLTKDTARRLTETGATATPAIVEADYAASSHQYAVSATMKTGGATFSANCSKCHVAQQGETATFMSRDLGVHDSPLRRLIAALGITTPTDPLEEKFCFRCHSRSTETGNLASPGGGPAKATADRDYYGVQAMTPPSQLIWRDFLTVTGTVASGSTTTVINVSGTTGWTANQWAGYSFDITSGTLAGQSRRITANTATSVTVTAAFASAPAAGVTYRIGARHPVDDAAATGRHKPIEGTTSNWMPAASRHVECEDCHDPHAAKDGRANTSGTVASSTATTLTASGTPNWPTDRWKGYLVNITTSGRGQARYIASNTANTLTIVGNWSTNPAAADTFTIVSAAWTTGGIATGATATTITDTRQAWTTNQWVGYYVKTVSGTGPEQVRLITANTATSLTVATWTTTPAAGTGYVIYAPPQISGVNAGISNVVTPGIETQGPASGVTGTPANMRNTAYTAKASAATTQYELCLKCHSTWAYGTEPSGITTPSRYPSAYDTWASGQTQTDIGKDFDTDNYAYHPLFAPGKNQPIRMGNATANALGQTIAYNTNWPNYTTGTVSVSAGSTALTGSGTTFPLGVGAGYWIFIGSATPTNPQTGAWAANTGWLPVAARNSATSLTLAVPSPFTASGVAFRLTKGLKSTFVDGWGPESLVTCTDCHNMSDTGVAKARGPHGSANRWILRNQEPQTITDLAGAVTTTSVANPINFCLNCHSKNVYGDTPVGGAFTAGANNNYGRFTHQENTSCQRLGSGANFYQIPCMNCHGGAGATTGTPGPGQIHGSSLGTGALGTTPRGFRFMNGASWKGHTSTLTPGGTCYTSATIGDTATPSGINGCSQHDGGRDIGAVNYQY